MVYNSQGNAQVKMISIDLIIHTYKISLLSCLANYFTPSQDWVSILGASQPWPASKPAGQSSSNYRGPCREYHAERNAWGSWNWVRGLLSWR